MKITRAGRGARSVDFRTFLGASLRAAQKRNPRFSLRAFARRLGVDHSTLSQILRGKRRITPRQAAVMGRRLGLAAEAIQDYARDLSRPDRPSRSKIRRLSFDADTFALLSLWHHSAILELTQVAGFKADSRWIAGMLGVPVDEINIALQRLLRLRLLQMDGRSRWIDSSGDVELRGAGLSPDAVRALQRRPHQLAIEAIDRRAPVEQLHDQMILALPARQMAALRKLVDDFMTDVRAAAGTRPRRAVYQVSVSIVPLTNTKGH